MLDRADKADATKADVYSLAKTLWVLLTGQTFPPPGEQRRDIPAIQVSTWVVFNKSEQIEDLIDKSTRYNPDDRPSMKEFHTTLLEALKQAKL
jgi:serine/threonine protein kinase